MYDKYEFTSAAWVPWSWDPDEARQAHQLSITWALEQAAELRARPVLRVHSHVHDWTHESTTYGPFAKVAAVVTDRGRGARGPTLVPFGHSMKLVAGGMACADGFSLVVEEHPALPLAAWAAELGAVNLRTGSVDPDPRAPEHAQRVRSMMSSLYNGWRSLPGSTAAKHWIPLLAAGGMTWADFAGTVLAVAPHRGNEKEMLRYAPPSWMTEISARMERNSKPAVR